MRKKKSKGGISICDTVVHFPTKRTPQRALYKILPTLFFIYQMTIQECTVFFQTPENQGHVQNNETRWNAGVYTNHLVLSICTSVAVTDAGRGTLNEWIVIFTAGKGSRNCSQLASHIHNVLRLKRLGLGLCLRFRNAQRDRVKTDWSMLWRGRCLARYVTHLLSLFGSLRTGKSLTSSAVFFSQASHHWFCHF